MTVIERLPSVRVERLVPSPFAKFKEPWVPFPEGVALMKELKSLLDRPDEGRPKSLALLAGPSYGKSHLLDHFADSFPSITDPGPPRIQVLAIELPPAADSGKLLRELLRGMSVDFSFRHPADELLRKVVIHVQSLRVGLIIIDEVHNALSGRRDRVIDVVQTIRALSNRTQRPIVVAGTEKVGEVLRYDEQLNQRFVRWALPLWDDPVYVKRMLAGFEAAQAFPGKERLASDKTALLVIGLTGGRPGTIAQLVRDARRRAASVRGEIDLESILKQCGSALAGAVIGV